MHDLEAQKLVNEMARNNAEMNKLNEETRKLAVESRKLSSDIKLEPWKIVLGTLIGGIFASVSITLLVIKLYSVNGAA